MNLLDAKVKKVLSKPYQKYGKWCVDVMYYCWGREDNTVIIVDTEDEAKEIKVGYEFYT